MTIPKALGTVGPFVEWLSFPGLTPNPKLRQNCARMDNCSDLGAPDDWTEPPPNAL